MPRSTLVSLESSYVLSLLPPSARYAIKGRYQFDFGDGTLRIEAEDALTAFRLQWSSLPAIRESLSKNPHHSIETIEYRWGSDDDERWRHPVKMPKVSA